MAIGGAFEGRRRKTLIGAVPVGPRLVIAGHPRYMMSSCSERGCSVLMMLATAVKVECKASLSRSRCLVGRVGCLCSRREEHYNKSAPIINTASQHASAEITGVYC